MSDSETESNECSTTEPTGPPERKPALHLLAKIQADKHLMLTSAVSWNAKQQYVPGYPGVPFNYIQLSSVDPNMDPHPHCALGPARAGHKAE